MEDVFAANILKKDANYAFVVLGDGPVLQDIKSLSESQNLYFFAKIPQNEVLAFLKDSDILYDGYLKSDLYKFGNSRNKYVEYCLASKPIVVSYSGFPLFVETEDCGIVVEPKSAKALVNGLQLLVNKGEIEMNRLGENATKFEPAQFKGGRIAAPTSQPIPSACHKYTFLSAST